MADSFSNPRLAREAKALADGLRALRTELQGARAEAEAINAGLTPAAQQRLEQSASKEAASRPGTVQSRRQAAAQTDLATTAERRWAEALRVSNREIAIATERLAALDAQRRGALLATTNRAPLGYMGQLQTLGSGLDPAFQRRAPMGNLGLLQALGARLDPAFTRPQGPILLGPGSQTSAGGTRVPIGAYGPTAGATGGPRFFTGPGGVTTDIYGRPMSAPVPPPITDAELAKQRAESLSSKLGEKLGPDPGQVSLSKELGKTSDEALTTEQRFAALQRRTGAMQADFQQLAREQGAAADQMHRHGLLTTEFITAAARGQTTLAELGTQVGGTIAKFGGWTLAASATYGALRAVQGLGKGAIDSVQGVNQLSRVVTGGLDTKKAQKDFRDLSNEFNLPVGTVTAAAYESAKAFKSEHDILLATKAALYGVRVGELDAATAGKVAIAVVRGFRLEAKDLGGVINSVNALQNKFGGNFGQIAQGVAAAAGSFGAAGGNYKQLAALISTGSQVTGRAGINIATSIQRTSELAFRPNRRQTIIDVLGIDPKDHSITDLFDRAFELVRKNPKNVGVIARALTTAEQASRSIIPILRNEDLYRARLAVANRPGNSASRELARLRNSPQYQLQEIGNNIQQIGAALAEAGAGQGLGLLLKGLNTTLNITEQIVAALQLIPAPIRQAGFDILPLVAGVKLLRRLDTGNVLGREGGVLSKALGRNPRASQRAEILSGLGDERTFLAREIEGASRSATRLTNQTLIAEQEVVRLQGVAGVEEDRLNVARERALRLEVQAQEAVALHNALLRQQNELIEKQTVIRRETSIFGGARDPKVVAAENGVLFYGSNKPRPNYEGAVPIAGAAAGASAARAGQTVLPGLEKEVAASTAAVAETSRIASLGTRISGGARALAIGLASDPFTIALAGAAGLYEFGKAVHEQQKKAQDEVNRLKALAYTEPDPAKIESEARAALASLSRNNLSTAWKYLSSSSQHPGFLNPKPGGRGGGGGGGGGLGATLSVFNPFDPVHFGGPLAAFNPIAQREVEREAARKALADAQRLRVQIPQGKGLFLSQIKKSYEDALRAANGDSDAINKARDTAIREILSGRGALYHPGKDTNARIKTRIAEVIAEAQSFKEIVGDIHAGLGDVIDAAGLGTAVAALQVRVGLFGFHKTEKAKASALALQAKQNIARTTDPKEIVANLTQMQAVEQLVSDNAQQAYQASLKRATTPAQSHAATNTYLSAVRSSLTGDLRSTIREIEAQSKVSPGILKRSGDTTNAVAGANHAISDLAAKLRQDGPVLKILRALYGHRQEILAGIAQDARAQQAQDDLSAFDAHTNLLLSEQTTDAGKQRVSANRLRQRAGIVRDQVKHHLARRQDLENAVADANNALNQGTQAADETLQRLQAQQGLAESRLALSGASQGTILRRAAADAGTYARAVRAHSGANSPDYINALRATVDAQKAVQDYVDQQAQAMAQAEADLATSRTDNPITRDNIAIGLAKRLKALAKTPDARITQQAAINNARRQRQADVFSQREQNIEDDLSFEKIDQQTAIARYSTLLHTMKLTRDQKRDLRQRIFQLKKDLESNSELDLDLSSLKLPTAYEIRRAVIGAQAGMAVTQTYQTTINVAKTADVSEVTSTFETYHRGIHKAAQRARKRR